MRHFGVNKKSCNLRPNKIAKFPFLKTKFCKFNNVSLLIGANLFVIAVVVIIDIDYERQKMVAGA